LDGNDNGNGSSTAIVRLHAPEKQGQDDETKKKNKERTWGINDFDICTTYEYLKNNFDTHAHT